LSHRRSPVLNESPDSLSTAPARLRRAGNGSQRTSFATGRPRFVMTTSESRSTSGSHLPISDHPSQSV